jgi:hypothetical protein
MEKITRRLCDLKLQKLELDYELYKNEKEQAELEALLIPIKERDTFWSILTYIGKIIPGSSVLMNLLFEYPDEKSVHTCYTCPLYSISIETDRSLINSKIHERHTIIIKTMNKTVERMIQSFFQQDMDAIGSNRRVWFQSPTVGVIMMK